MIWLTVLLGIITVFIFVFYRRRKNKLNVFKKLGIPGPEPHWLTGNFGAMKDKLPFQAIQGWSQQYGKVFGYYEGPTPLIVSSDLDFLEEVFIKQFSKFNGRKLFPLVDTKQKNTSMFFAGGEKWKRLRTIINPTFSMAKLKVMASGMNSIASTMMDKLDKACEAGEPFNIYEYYQGLTLEVIGHLAVGVDTNAQTDPDDPFLRMCRKTFDQLTHSKIYFIGAAILPEFAWFIRKLRAFSERSVEASPRAWMLKKVGEVIEQRRSERQSERRIDLMQLLLDAEDPNFSPGLENTPNSDPQSRKKLSNGEAQAQATLFLIAGYETTSTALGYVTYLLAKNPEVQAKLQSEIDQYITNQDCPAYDEIQKMAYLEMVLCEALRLYPIASGIATRRCMESCTVRGYDVLPGIAVQADMWTIHKDPQQWPDPEQFDPDRFLPENKKSRHPMAWIPFGAGPRNCVGMRFAMMEAKLTLCRILRKFTIQRCDQTPDSLPLKETATVTPKDGIIIKLVRRKLQLN